MKKDIPYNELALLPINIEELMDKKLYAKVIKANKELATLNGIEQMNNRKISEIFLNSLVLTESIDSNIIENINTTIDSIAVSKAINDIRGHEKETLQYKEALMLGLEKMNNQDNILTLNTIEEIQAKIEENNAGFRKVSGTKLENEQTGEVIYFPPESHVIPGLLNNLESYINENNLQNIDPCIKSAIIHYQFESIHPFLDGNGRTGRILILLYLIKEGLLNFPILYISGYINQNKSDYYRLLQEVKTKHNWKDYIFYMLDAIEKQAQSTSKKILCINSLYKEKRFQFKKEANLENSGKILDSLFQNIYVSFGDILSISDVSKPTLIKRLNNLEKNGLVNKVKDGKNTLYFIGEYLKILKK